jgi:hypothetical protein
VTSVSDCPPPGAGHNGFPDSKLRTVFNCVDINSSAPGNVDRALIWTP